MKYLSISLGCLFFVQISFSQGVSISNPPGAPDASAMLDVKSNNKGLLIPRMTQVSRNAIPSPATGLMIYQTDGTPGFYYYNGSSWSTVGAGGGGDNLGNHQLSSNLRTGNYYLSKYGSSIGIRILDSGSVSIVGDNRGGGYASGGVGERFRLDESGGFLAKSILGVGKAPASGSGERMMWDPYHAAFRAGSVGSGNHHWDHDNNGFYSTAFGYSTTSSALGTFAAGYLTGAYGNYAFAMGYNSHATGTASIALGYRCTADASYSVALGQRASTNGYNGAFVFSDASTTDSTEANASNRFFARFANGYRLYTNSTTTLGVYINGSGNSWASISDSTKKENYQQASNEDFLAKLSNLKLGSWNYKGQDPATFRHYGPMAQEIFAAYGKDHYGTIGCDTLLTTADMDGIMMIMLQGLEKRSRESAEKIAVLENTNTQLHHENIALQKENVFIKKQLAEMADLKAEVKRLIMETKNATALKD